MNTRTIPHSAAKPATDEVDALGLGAHIELDATSALADDPKYPKARAEKIGRNRWRLAAQGETTVCDADTMLAAATYEGITIYSEGIWVDEPCSMESLDEELYHADPVRDRSVSQSSIKTLLQSAGPARFLHRITSPPERRAAFDFGSAAHALVLGVGAPIHRLQHPDLRTKAAKAEKAAAEAEGKVVLRPDDFDTVVAMADALSSHAGAMATLDGDHEVSAFAQDPQTDVWIRGRFDIVGDGWIGDYKTAASADPRVFARKAADFGYHLQAAWYTRLAQLVNLFDEPPAFRFVVQEKTSPFLVSVIELDADFLDLGDADMDRALALYAECRDAGQWPGYPDDPHVVAPPPWMRQPATDLDPDLIADLTALAQGEAA